MTAHLPTAPLAAFSPYLAGRHRVLLTIAAEVARHLDTCDGDGLPTTARERASDLMWLWTLGAYEVTRTMCQAQACFAPRFYRELSHLKADLERVRVASAKMERVKYDRKDRSIPIPSDREPDRWHGPTRDLLVGDPAAPASARGLIAAYERVLASLTADEVLGRHEDAFAGA